MKKASLLLPLFLLTGLAAHAETIEMKVHGMVCGFCVQGIETSLRKNSATADVVVSLENKVVVVQTRDGETIADEDLKKAIAEAGYDLKSVTRTQRSMKEVREELLIARQ
jgi:copper chaperone CopZ